MAAALAACGSGTNAESTESKARHSAERHASGPTIDDLTKGMASAASQGKPTAPIDIKFDIKQKPVVGGSVDIELAFLPETAADGLAVDLVPSDGVTLQAAANPIQIAGIEAGKVYRRTVSVVAGSDGMFYLGVVAAVKTTDQTQSRSFSIPLIVGSPVMAAKPAVRKDARGQALETSAAVETVH